MVTEDLRNHFDPGFDSRELKIIYESAKRGDFLKSLQEWALDTENLDISTHDVIAQLIQDFCESQLEQDE